MRPAWKKNQQRGARRVSYPRPVAGVVVAETSPADQELLERVGLVDDSEAFAASKFADDDTDEDFYDRLAFGGGSGR